MRRIFGFCAVAAIGFTAFAASSPAHLIRWEGTGVRQVWDQSIPIKPIPSNYKTVSKPVPTFAAALAVKDGMLKKGSCKL
jgi:hypothetical protein